MELKNFEVDLYSKSNTSMKKITMDLDILLNDSANESALKDALNVIVSSFYAEDLLSSKGKEAFKEALKKYALSKHKINISQIYILELKQLNDIDIEKLIKVVEEHYKTSKNPKPNINDESRNEAQKLIEEQMRNSTKMLDNMRDFGEVDFYQ